MLARLPACPNSSLREGEQQLFESQPLTGQRPVTTGAEWGQAVLAGLALPTRKRVRPERPRRTYWRSSTTRTQPPVSVPRIDERLLILQPSARYSLISSSTLPCRSALVKRSPDRLDW